MLLICAPFYGTLLWWSLHLMKLGHHFFLSSLKKNDVASNFKTASESGFKFKVDSPPWFWIMQGLCYSKAKLCMLRHLQFSWVFCKAKSKFWEQPLRAPLKANGIGVCALEIKQGHDMCPPALVVLSMGARCLQFVTSTYCCWYAQYDSIISIISHSSFDKSTENSLKNSLTLKDPLKICKSTENLYIHW
jgi:hypothetical protein